ncbi:MAG: uL15 family ribosomal protein [Candidatus Pacearchaeota archaeon]|jgi:large subunit ribosomal protein L15
MVVKTKKKKKSKRLHGGTTYGHGSRKKWRSSGEKGGSGMAGTGKRADHKKSLIIKLYGNTYFGKQGVTSRSTKRKKVFVMNLKDINEKFPGKTVIELKKYKILGEGELDTKLTITARAFSESAREKIEKAGGKIIIFEPRKKPEENKKKVKEKSE